MQANAKNPTNLRPITREEKSLVVGGLRAHRPFVGGLAHFCAIKVQKRTDTGKPLFDYLPGYMTIPEGEVTGTLAREKMDFLVRPAQSHDDMPEFIRLYAEAVLRVEEHLGVNRAVPPDRMNRETR